MNTLNQFEKELTGALAASRPIRASVGTMAADSDANTSSQTCRTAIQRAVALRQLKAQYRSTGFLALPLDQYCVRLADAAGVEIPDDVSEPRKGSLANKIAPWINLARQLDVVAEHLQVWTRAWFAREFLLAPTGAMARNHAPGNTQAGVPILEERLTENQAATVLARVELHYGIGLRTELDRALKEIE